MDAITLVSHYLEQPKFHDMIFLHVQDTDGRVRPKVGAAAGLTDPGSRVEPHEGAAPVNHFLFALWP